MIASQHLKNCLLKISQSISIHNKNLQVIATELYKVHNGLAPDIMNDIFKIRETTYNLRKEAAFSTRRVKSVQYGLETISILGPKIWDMLPKNIKDSESVEIFKLKVKLWKPEKCPCRLCKVYLPNLGFI